MGRETNGIDPNLNKFLSELLDGDKSAEQMDEHWVTSTRKYRGDRKQDHAILQVTHCLCLLTSKRNKVCQTVHCQ